MKSRHYESWGRMFGHDADTISVEDLKFNPKATHGHSVLAYGMGRSYGDVCVNEDGLIVPMQNSRQVLSLDKASGLLTCQAGASFADLLPLIMPTGWFLPVTPGTKFVTLGGAIANDVHGKNHHVSGTFGCHVTRLKLLRTDGTITDCGPQQNTDLFRATIGGLGLTGIITQATIKLVPIKSYYIHAETLKFSNLDQFLELSKDSASYPYTVAWMDLVNTDKDHKGIFFRGRHSEQTHRKDLPNPLPSLGSWANVPVDMPAFLVNPWNMKAFNRLYYHAHRNSAKDVFFDRFFYPLDTVNNWNRIYGKNGFFQFQFVLPFERTDKVKSILGALAKSSLGSFLCVAKTFGEIASPGMLSFPMPGITIALDFPNRPEATRLVKELEQVVSQSGGRIYPAKDSLMSPQTFQSSYNVQEFIRYKDPGTSSNFWQRITSK
jgi:FAD/FMN-containing dehydrogenase